jgi:hypothetical protein
MTNYLLNAISHLILSINTIFIKKSLDKMGLAYVKMIFDKIIAFEKKLLKFDIKTLFKNRVDTSKKDDTYDEFDVYINSTEDASGENVDAIGPDIGEDQEENIFSINDLDVEIEDEEDDNLFVDTIDRIS